MSQTTSAELGMWLVVPQQTAVPLTASLSYSKADPYAVRFNFNVGLNETVEWIFARDLLITGVATRTGLGDVQVWPSNSSEDGTSGSFLHIGLSSPFGQAQFEMALADIVAFLGKTYAIVAPGEEDTHINMDAAIAELLRQRG